MRSLYSLKILTFLIFFGGSVFAQDSISQLDRDFLSWNAKQTIQFGETWREKGRIGGLFDGRILSTDKSYNYKLRATLMSPEAIRAAARREQLRNGLTVDETRKLVVEAEKENSLILLVEIDPREGSGVIPNDWRVLLNAKGSGTESNKPIRGVKNQSLGEILALKGVSNRDYDYDLFWVAFPLKDESGKPFWNSVPTELELVVGIYNKEGRVTWKVSDALKLRIEALLKK